MDRTNDDGFVTITNKDIYNKLCDLKEDNAKSHNEIILHQKETNGKVKLNKWVATTALSLITLVIMYFVGALIGKI